jgi:hypothetical protein
MLSPQKHRVKTKIWPKIREQKCFPSKNLNARFSPMDLTTIKKLIDENYIKTLTELNDQFILMCMNAIMFNDPEHTVAQDARELKLFCAQTIQVAFSPSHLIAPLLESQTSDGSQVHSTLEREATSRTNLHPALRWNKRRSTAHEYWGLNGERTGPANVYPFFGV